ncbi:MAG: response regulator [Candidatus Binatia bacterium]|nr:response regulator [Candidatus Binatia bacterium]
MIFLAALSEASNKLKGLTLGAVDYISKPFERALVLAGVRSHLELHRLTDLIMPGMSGLNACLQLKARPETLEIPLVLLSLRTGFPEEEKGCQFGAVEYLYKPFGRAEFTACVP